MLHKPNYVNVIGRNTPPKLYQLLKVDTKINQINKNIMGSSEELKMLFQMSYVPVAQVMQRLNGKDFIGVAVPLLDSIRKQTSDPNRIKEAAQMFVYCFNEMLDPKLSFSDMNDMVSLLVNNGPLVRKTAEEALKEFNQTLARRKGF